MKIALVGNPNAGKTTLFNAYTGSSQYVGNWPGVTVEKKEGKFKRANQTHIITDLPGVYSLSPYSSEEVITRDYILNEQPDVVIDIVDAVNLERNLYLTTQILDMNVPVVVALNRVDMVDQNNINLDIDELSKRLGVPVLELVASKSKGVQEVIDTALSVAINHKRDFKNFYSTGINKLLQEIQDILPESLKDNKLYHSIKIFENDQVSYDKYKYDTFLSKELNDKIEAFKLKKDDDGEAIIINEKYDAVAKILDGIYHKKIEDLKSTSDKIDKVITNKWLGLPIFFLVMWFIYYISIQTVGDMTISYVETGIGWIYDNVTSFLTNLGASEMVLALVGDGIINSLGAIFTFVPQLMILFIFMSILEDSGYMSRVAFIMDRIFRKFGLSGKSFIPMLIGTGCSIPGVMATRTIENEKDREMTILLTPFVPCGAKLPVFALFISMIFTGKAWVGPMIYLIAFLGIIISGIVLKKTKRFKGRPTPFVMELPPYTVPTIKGVVIHMWERAKGFIKKAGTIIFIGNVIIWFLISFNFKLQYLGENINQSMLASFGNIIRYLFIPLGLGHDWTTPVAIFTGLLAKETVVSTFATIGSVVPISFTQVSAFAFIVFTIFAAPCFAAIGAMGQELGSRKKTYFAVFYQTGLAYVLALLTNQIGQILLKNTNATKEVFLDYTRVGKLAEEGADSIVAGPIFLYIIGIFLLISVITIIANYLKVRKYRTNN